MHQVCTILAWSLCSHRTILVRVQPRTLHDHAIFVHILRAFAWHDDIFNLCKACARVVQKLCKCHANFVLTSCLNSSVCYDWRTSLRFFLYFLQIEKVMPRCSSKESSCSVDRESQATVQIEKVMPQCRSRESSWSAGRESRAALQTKRDKLHYRSRDLNHSSDRESRATRESTCSVERGSRAECWSRELSGSADWHNWVAVQIERD